MITRSALFAPTLLLTSLSAAKVLADTSTFSFLKYIGPRVGQVEEFGEATPTVFYVTVFRQVRFFGQPM